MQTSEEHLVELHFLGCSCSRQDLSWRCFCQDNYGNVSSNIAAVVTLQHFRHWEISKGKADQTYTATTWSPPRLVFTPLMKVVWVSTVRRHERGQPDILAWDSPSGRTVKAGGHKKKAV